MWSSMVTTYQSIVAESALESLIGMKMKQEQAWIFPLDRHATATATTTSTLLVRIFEVVKPNLTYRYSQFLVRYGSNIQ